MPDLHKILKDTRIQQGIELEEIHNRTKININFLMALENGDYDILPTPYIRLFLRAYGNEVGLDPEELIAQYEESQTGEETSSTSKDKKTVEQLNDGNLGNKTNERIVSSKKNPKKNRDNLKKGGALLLIWIFGIYIINKITDSPEPTNPGSYYSTSDFISELNTNFIESSNEEQQLSILPPYSLNIKTVSQLNLYITSDTVDISNILLNSGEHKSFFIDNNLTIVFEHTQNVNISINGNSEEIKLYEYQNSTTPLKINITADPPAYSVRQYTPRNR